MPQFAVITRSFRVLTPSEHDADVRMSSGPRRNPRNCVFDKPKAFLVTASDADAAMSLVKRCATSKGIELIVHRAVEVSETLSG